MPTGQSTTCWATQSFAMRNAARVDQESMCLSYQTSMLLLTGSSTALSSVTTKHTWLHRAWVIGPPSSQTWELESGSENALYQQAPPKDKASSFPVYNMHYLTKLPQKLGKIPVSAVTLRQIPPLSFWELCYSGFPFFAFSCSLLWLPQMYTTPVTCREALQGSNSLRVCIHWFQ